MELQLLGVGVLVGWAVWLIGRRSILTLRAAVSEAGCGSRCGGCAGSRSTDLGQSRSGPRTAAEVTFVPVGDLTVRRRF